HLDVAVRVDLDVAAGAAALLAVAGRFALERAQHRGRSAGVDAERPAVAGEPAAARMDVLPHDHVTGREEVHLAAAEVATRHVHLLCDVDLPTLRGDEDGTTVRIRAA